MAAHWLSLRTTVSAVENLDVICDSIAWLSGEPDSIKVGKTKSHHGSNMYSVTCKLTKNKSIQCVLDNLGDEIKADLVANPLERLDSNDCLHFRVSKTSLIAGKPEISPPGSSSSVKFSIKVKKFGNQTTIGQVSELLG